MDHPINNLTDNLTIRGERLASTYYIMLYFWAHKDLNLGPTDYESAALTN